MEFKFTRGQVMEEIGKFDLSPDDRERILLGLDLSDVARCLGSRLGDYAEEWLRDKVIEFLDVGSMTRPV